MIEKLTLVSNILKYKTKTKMNFLKKKNKNKNVFFRKY
jgi:hypothetical protein